MKTHNGITISVPGAELAKRLELRRDHWRANAALLARQLGEREAAPLDVEVHDLSFLDEEITPLTKGPLKITPISARRERKESLRARAEEQAKEQRKEELRRITLLIESAQERAEYCAWLARHVDRDAVYELGPDDLHQLAPPPVERVSLAGPPVMVKRGPSNLW